MFHIICRKFGLVCRITPNPRIFHISPCPVIKTVALYTPMAELTCKNLRVIAKIDRIYDKGGNNLDTIQRCRCIPGADKRLCIFFREVVQGALYSEGILTGNVGVTLGGTEGGMAEEGLDITDIGAAFKEVGCKGVAEAVY